MSQSLFGGGERPPSPPNTAGKPPAPQAATPSSTPASSSSVASSSTPAPSSTPASLFTFAASSTVASSPASTASPKCASNSCLPTEVEIDPRGDLILVVGHTSEVHRNPIIKLAPSLLPKPIAFRVCSRAMARAAPFFETLLYGRFAEAKKQESGWKVRLPDDDPEAMGLLLPVLHGRFAAFDALIPSLISSVELLYRVTVLTDKYDLSHILRPWATQLVNGLKETMKNLTVMNLERALWISWELGSRIAFKFILGQMAWKKPKGLFLAQAPPRVEAAIEQARLDAIKALLKPIKDSIDSSISQKRVPDHGFRCKRADGNTESCQLIITGSLMQSLHAMGLWPLPTADAWEWSGEKLQDTLYKSLVIKTYGGHSSQGLFSANNCYGVIKHINGRVSWCPQIDVAMSQQQLDHLTAQAAKTGLDANA